MPCAHPSKFKKPPGTVVAMGNKIPCPYALILVWDNGKVENAEFVADMLEGGEILWKEYFSWHGEWARWKQKVLPTIPVQKNYELWAKWRKDYFMVHPDNLTIKAP